MRLVFGLSFLALPLFLFGQLGLLPIDQSSDSFNARISSSNTTNDTISLPFWDDFSQGYLDTTKWLFGNDVYINNTQSINPPTMFVATFDGVNQFGRSYVEGSEYNGAGDSLVSLPIDLTLVPIDRRNTVFLSFFWELKGFGEIPNENDSLRLQFFARDSSWITQDINPSSDHLSLLGGLVNLSFDGDSVLQFQQVIIPVLDPIYFHQGFKFRFQSFSSLAGVYDSWHIDYIYLNSNRSINDTFHFDRAISGSTTSLLYPYLSIPLDQFSQNPSAFLGFETVVLSNLDNTFHPARFSYQIQNLTSGSLGSRNFIVPDDMRPGEIGRAISIENFNLPSMSGDSIVLETITTYITGDKQLFEEVDQVTGDTVFLSPDLAINDTLRNQYTLYNYLAYDDGSAELAAGIPLRQGQIAVAFYLPTPDTLTDVLINFPAISPSSVGQSIELRVWTDLDDLAILRQFGGTIESKARDEFQVFTLNTPVIVRDTFYLGFVQETDNYIGVGFDKNNLGGMDKIYTNTNFNWVKNTVQQGSLMIRPVFRDAGDFVLGHQEEFTSTLFYPNPAFDYIYFKAPFNLIKIYNLNGQVLTSCTNCQSLNIASIPAGTYLVTQFSKDRMLTQKLIKK